MGRVYWSAPCDLIDWLITVLDLKYAVETGTYRGTTTDFLRHRFREVWTVEADPMLAAQALGRFQGTNVDCRHGDSGEVLHDVVATVPGPALFWLDAHWFDELPRTTTTECPLLDELEAIRSFPHAGGSVILIDDSHMFLEQPPPPNTADQWPSITQLSGVVSDLGDFIAVVEDVIICAPGEIERPLSDYYRERETIVTYLA